MGAETAWKKQYYTGWCYCGHHWEDHHGNMVASQDYIDQTGEWRYAGECEAHGWNEFNDGHCGHYWDVGNPEPDYSPRRPHGAIFRRKEWMMRRARHYYWTARHWIERRLPWLT
jgi:hypothetical protein